MESDYEPITVAKFLPHWAKIQMPCTLVLGIAKKPYASCVVRSSLSLFTNALKANCALNRQTPTSLNTRDKNSFAFPRPLKGNLTRSDYD